METHRWFSRSAAVYDHIYEQIVDYDGEAAEIDRLIRERVPDASTVVEFASGTGQFLRRLASRYDVAGSDLSEEMVAVSRERAPRVEVRVGDYRTVDHGRRFDAALCLFSSIGYVEDTASAVANMVRHLRPGGVLIVDGWLRPAAAEDRFLGLGCFEGAEMVVARSSHSEISDDRMVMDMGHLVTTRDGSEFFVERHETWLRTDDEYIEAFTRAGLTDITVLESPWPERGRFIGSVEP